MQRCLLVNVVARSGTSRHGRWHQRRAYRRALGIFERHFGDLRHSHREILPRHLVLTRSEAKAAESLCEFRHIEALVGRLHRRLISAVVVETDKGLASRTKSWTVHQVAALNLAGLGPATDLRASSRLTDTSLSQRCCRFQSGDGAGGINASWIGQSRHAPGRK